MRITYEVTIKNVGEQTIPGHGICSLGSTDAEFVNGRAAVHVSRIENFLYEGSDILVNGPAPVKPGHYGVATYGPSPILLGGLINEGSTVGPQKDSFEAHQESYGFIVLKQIESGLYLAIRQPYPTVRFRLKDDLESGDSADADLLDEDGNSGSGLMIRVHDFQIKSGYKLEAGAEGVAHAMGWDWILGSADRCAVPSES